MLTSLLAFCWSSVNLIKMFNIFERNTLKAGKMRPLTIATKIPNKNKHLESLAYEKSLVKIDSSYFFSNSSCSFFSFSYLVSSTVGWSSSALFLV
jgi:hypothetical protein